MAENKKSLFDTLEKEAFRSGIQARTKDSSKWFRSKVQELGAQNPQKVLKDSALIQKRGFRTGSMYMFFYDPKHRKTLPYYDAFPLIIAVERAKGGFYGLNLHYLPPVLRAKFLDKLMENTNNRKFDETTRMKINYQILKSVGKLKEFAPCFKHYLTGHVNSNIAMVEAPEWEIAIFLKTESFKKKSKSHVWGQSRRAY
jgi:ABC-type oligopeptide transport system ATPase subunit